MGSMWGLTYRSTSGTSTETAAPAYRTQQSPYLVLGDADGVAPRDLHDVDPARHCRCEVDVVAADARGHGELELGRRGDARGREVRRPERL